MKNEITLNLRVFPVTVQDLRTGEKMSDTITLEKSQVKACQLVGQCVTDLIYRMYNREGYRVLEVGRPRKAPLVVGLSDE